MLLGSADAKDERYPPGLRMIIGFERLEEGTKCLLISIALWGSTFGTAALLVGALVWWLPPPTF
jgi:hypothetical protein